MTIHWASLLAVFAVSLTTTVTVVVLVTLALVGLSARATRTAAPDMSTRPPPYSPSTGTAMAGTCLAAAALIVLLGLWTIIAT